MENAVFAAGCFWGVEAAYQKIEGVTKTEVGYAGGHVDQPTYKQVCTGQTGHAEVVLIEFDPKIVSYEKLLEVFWKLHDPTQLNRQGVDVGTQYRSEIFTTDDIQVTTANENIKKAQSDFTKPIVTKVSSLTNYFAAEEYHQKYFEKNPGSGCLLN